MDDDIQKVRETTISSGDTVQKITEVKNEGGAKRHRQNLVEKVVWYVAGIIIVLLGFRFVLSMLGANRTNAFADFIYSTSEPLVKPFFSLFNYNDYVYGVSRIEIFTIVAIIFYSVAAWGIASLVTLNRD